MGSAEMGSAEMGYAEMGSAEVEPAGMESAGGRSAGGLAAAAGPAGRPSPACALYPAPRPAARLVYRELRVEAANPIAEVATRLGERGMPPLMSG